MKLKILISGSRGFIGKELIKELRKKKISYLTIKTSELKKNNFNYKNITHFLHLGFRMGTTKSNTSEINIKKNLADIKKICKTINSKIKLIFISSIGVNCYKNTNKIAKNKYLYSKFKCENFLVKNFKNYLIIRLPNVYGLNQKDNFLIPSILKKLKKNKKQIKINNFHDKRDYIFLNDVVKIIIRSFKIKKNFTLNIFSNNVFSVYDVVRLIIKKLNIKNCNIIKLKKNSIFKKGYYMKEKNSNMLNLKKFVRLENGINFIKKIL
jgi:nucleoside-diphosphate-sugar epimerase